MRHLTHDQRDETCVAMDKRESRHWRATADFSGCCLPFSLLLVPCARMLKLFPSVFGALFIDDNQPCPHGTEFTSLEESNEHDNNG